MNKIEIKVEQRNVLTAEVIQEFLDSDLGKKRLELLGGIKQNPVRKKRYFQRLIHKFFG